MWHTAAAVALLDEHDIRIVTLIVTANSLHSQNQFTIVTAKNSHVNSIVMLTELFHPGRKVPAFCVHKLSIDRYKEHTLALNFACALNACMYTCISLYRRPRACLKLPCSCTLQCSQPYLRTYCVCPIYACTLDCYARNTCTHKLECPYLYHAHRTFLCHVP